MIPQFYNQHGVPHKHASVIKQWADGAIVQFRIPQKSEEWKDFTGTKTCPCWNLPGHEWRVKPAPSELRYRRYISGFGANAFVENYVEGQNRSPREVEKGASFNRWIDHEWAAVPL